MKSDNLINKINRLQSEELRNLANYLHEKGVKITYFGVAWFNSQSNWVYFDTKLDLRKLRKEFNLSPDIVVHVNEDRKSGTEAGFVDQRTDEGLMGLL